MKNKIYSILAIAGIALGLGSCADTFDPGTSTHTGEVSLKSMGIEVSQTEIVVSRAEIDLNPFIVTIYNDAEAVQKQWRFSEMPEIFSLPVGKYTVEVKSHEVEKASWDSPLYVGTKEFEIEKNKITDIGTVVCKFASLKVTVNFGDDLRKVMGSDVKVRVVANDAGELIYTPDETRAGYFEVVDGSTTLAAYFTGTVNNTAEDITSTYTEVKAGMHYILNYSLRTNPLEPDPETGQIDPSQGINVQTGIEEVGKDGSVNNDEDLIDTDPDYNHEEFVEEVDLKYDASARQIAVTAAAGLASVTVTVASDENNEFNTYFRALNGADLAVSNMSQFGLPAPAQVKDATVLTIDLTTLIEQAQEFEGSHEFTFNATDKEGSVGEAVSVVVKGRSAVGAITFESALSFTDPMDPNDYDDGKVFISAANGIDHLYLTCSSTSDDFDEILQGLTNSDLAEPGDLKSAFDQFRLKNGADVKGQTEVEFDITEFIPMILLFTGDVTSTFTIEAVDTQGNSESITLTFYVK